MKQKVQPIPRFKTSAAQDFAQKIQEEDIQKDDTDTLCQQILELQQRKINVKNIFVQQECQINTQKKTLISLFSTATSKDVQKSNIFQQQNIKNEESSGCNVDDSQIESEVIKQKEETIEQMQNAILLSFEKNNFFKYKMPDPEIPRKLPSNSEFKSPGQVFQKLTQFRSSIADFAIRPTESQTPDSSQKSVRRNQPIFNKTNHLNGPINLRNYQKMQTEISPEKDNIKRQNRHQLNKLAPQNRIESFQDFSEVFSSQNIKPLLSENDVLSKEPLTGRRKDDKQQSRIFCDYQPMILRQSIKIVSDEAKQQQLIKILIANDLEGLKKFTNTNDFQKFINKTDILGNTPLILLIKLYGFQESYLNLLKYLLSLKPDPFIKNPFTGWTALDESLSQRSVIGTASIFQLCYFMRRQAFEEQQECLNSVIENIDNFYLKMDWSFDSPLPFIKSLAPSDTIKVWKFKNSIRVDSTLVGFHNLQCKRRNMSLLFNGQINKGPKLIQINHFHHVYTDPLEELDLEEKKLIIHDLLDCEPINGNLNIVDCSLQESLNWRGKKILQFIDNIVTEKYDLQITLKSSITKKLKDTQQKFEIEQKIYNQWFSDASFKLEKCEDVKYVFQQKSKEATQKSKIQIWIQRDHQLKFKDFNKILQYLSKGNQLLDSLSKIFSRKEIAEIMDINGFPIKIQIPFQYSIHATIHFTEFQKMLDIPTSLMTIPLSFKYQSRKIYQKTIEKKNKRILISNMYL